VNSRKLRLITLDDGYEPTRTAPNMLQLIEKDNVLGDIGTPTAIVAVPLANDQRILLFAAYSGGPILRYLPPDHYVINFRAGYAEETAEMIDALIDIAGLKPEEIAFFTQRDSYVDVGFAVGMIAFKRHGIRDPKTVSQVNSGTNNVGFYNLQGESINHIGTAFSPSSIRRVQCGFLFLNARDSTASSSES
jgi:branched-chain amino acid transport system substrate-binding protein